MNWFELILVVMVLYFMMKHLSPQLAKVFMARRRVYEDKNPDINKRMKTILIRNAKLQKPKYSRWLELHGDPKKADCTLGKVVGLCEDRRVIHIAYKPGLLSFSRLLLVPGDLQETTSLNKRLIIRANGIKPVSMGLIDNVILTENDITHQEKYRKQIKKYWGYLLEEEKSFLIPERSTHNVLTAPGSTKIDTEMLLQAEREYAIEED